MQTHHTKNKGDIGVLKASADLAEQGYLVLSPLSEHSPFDIVVYRNKIFYRVQVKYRKLKNGALQVDFRSSYSDSSGVHTIETDKSEIDIFCIYCPDTDKCYYIQPEKFAKSVSLRLDPPKNKQLSGVHLASNYRKIPEKN